MSHHSRHLRRGHGQRRPSAFTLLELAVVTSLMLIATAVAYPSMVSYYENQKLEQTASELHGYLLRAQSMAQRCNSAHTVAFTATTVSVSSDASQPSCGTNLGSLNLRRSNNLDALCISRDGSTTAACTPSTSVVFTARGVLAGANTTLYLASGATTVQYCLGLGLSMIRLGYRNGSDLCTFVRS